MRGSLIAAIVVTAGITVLATTARMDLVSAQQGGPNHPPAQALTLDPSNTALLVLDLNERCADPAQTCSQLVSHVRPLIDKARAAGAYIVFTVSPTELGTGREGVWSGFERRPEEPVIYPGTHFDKFQQSELHDMLDAHGIQTVIVTGASSNVAVLYTATGAAKVYGYNVVIPYDGMNSASAYQDEYTVHQLTVLPTINSLFSFTTVDLLNFGQPGAM